MLQQIIIENIPMHISNHVVLVFSLKKTSICSAQKRKIDFVETPTIRSLWIRIVIDPTSWIENMDVGVDAADVTTLAFTTCHP